MSSDVTSSAGFIAGQKMLQLLRWECALVAEHCCADGTCFLHWEWLHVYKP